MGKYTTFIDWLEEWFIETNVFVETPITKDNWEKLFELFLEKQDNEKMIEWAELFGRWQYIEGQRRMLEERKVM